METHSLRDAYTCMHGNAVGSKMNLCPAARCVLVWRSQRKIIKTTGTAPLLLEVYGNHMLYKREETGELVSPKQSKDQKHTKSRRKTFDKPKGSVGTPASKGPHSLNAESTQNKYNMKKAVVVLHMYNKEQEYRALTIGTGGVLSRGHLHTTGVC